MTDALAAPENVTLVRRARKPGSADPGSLPPLS